MKLRWEPSGGTGEIAMLRDVQIGLIVPMADDPATWGYSVDGIRVKWIAKANGYVKGKASARRAVERAFSAWAQRAGIG